MTAGLIANTKQYCKARLREAHRYYVGAFHAFSAAELEDALRRVGIRAGDTLLVHSAYDAFQGFTGKPTDVLDALRNAVGPAGAVMMPTLPFTGTAVEYVRTKPVFDVRRTPSRMGLLTELFRRSPDVVRSVHPTHPVAVWGSDAAALARDHHLAGTPCGAGTPFARLLEREGKIVLAGTDISVLTFFHTIEELLEAKLPFSPFTTEVFTLESRDQLGSLVTTHTRLFEPAVSRRRNIGKLVPELRQSGGWREETVGRLRITVLDARSVFETASAMAERGAYCYD